VLNWDFLIDEAAFASVLPDEYAHLSRPIAGAFAVFLQGLPTRHQAAILTDQSSLPSSAPTADRLAALARCCPVLHKLGQIIARDRRLSPELKKHFQGLESLPPSIPLETIRSALTQELGPLERLGITLVAPALAEASVAVVVPFRYDHLPKGQGPCEGVFKVLKPGIEDRLQIELELLDRVGSYLDEKCDEFQIPHLDYQDSFAQIRDKLQYEIRLDLEQQNLVQARSFYAGEPRVQIPALLDPCTRRVTAMDWVVGEKVTENGLDSPCERRHLANLVAETVLGRPLFHNGSKGLFHGDPHAGNLFLTRDNRLAILDWSLVGSLDEPDRIAIMQIMLGALAYDAEKIITTLDGMAGRRRADRPALESAVHAWLRRIGWGQLPGFTWLIGLLDEVVQAAGLRVSSDLLLFRKALHTLQGVIADVEPGSNQIDKVLLGEFFRHLALESPQRWLALPNSRAFATRLSNADLMLLTMKLPWAPTRYWLDQFRYWQC
jgi:ubiquinone biosynthesis protein